MWSFIRHAAQTLPLEPSRWGKACWQARGREVGVSDAKTMCSFKGGGRGGAGGKERNRDTENETEFAARKKGFSSWSRAGSMFSRHDKGGKYFI